MNAALDPRSGRPGRRPIGPLDWSVERRWWPHAETSSFHHAGGLRWHVQQMGQGPAVLLIHGTGASTHSWRALAPRLAEQFKVIAPDLPGHGFTERAPRRRMSLPAMAESVAALAEALVDSPGAGCRTLGGCGHPGPLLPRWRALARRGYQPQRCTAAVSRGCRFPVSAAGQAVVSQSPDAVDGRAQRQRSGACRSFDSRDRL